jgi:hypothetical protein
MADDKDTANVERTPTPADNPRNKRMAEIASAEENSKTDLVDVADGDHDKTAEVVEEAVAEVAAPSPQKFKIKANGQEEELTHDELIKRAELATGAQQKFQEAARLRKEAEELRKPPEKETASTVDEDDRALARALQNGNEEEAAAVIRKIRTRPSEPADVQRLVDQRLDFRNSAEWFQQEYPDIVQDTNLLQLVLAEDEKLVNGGDKRPYKERYEQIGNSLRKWRDGLKAPASSEERRERKATLQVVPAASVRSAPPREEDDGPDDRAFIAAEAKRRGQGYPK